MKNNQDRCKKKLDLRVDPHTAAEDLVLRMAVSTQLGIDVNRIKHIRITRRSIDARQRRVMVNLTVDVWIDEEPDSTGPEIHSPVYATLPSGAPRRWWSVPAPPDSLPPCD